MIEKDDNPFDRSEYALIWKRVRQIQVPGIQCSEKVRPHLSALSELGLGQIRVYYPCLIWISDIH
jgi:hypothetical protein